MKSNFWLSFFCGFGLMVFAGIIVGGFFLAPLLGFIALCLVVCVVGILNCWLNQTPEPTQNQKEIFKLRKKLGRGPKVRDNVIQFPKRGA